MTDRPIDRPASDTLVYDRDAGLERLLEIMARLRAPDGCPWDQKQDFQSIAPYTIEEACEVAEAIQQGDRASICDELGDLLLQVIYHARIAEEEGSFTFQDVVQGISDKMLRRHPHVFGTELGGETANPDDVDWEAIKAIERAAKGETRDSVLDGLPTTLSGMTRALKLTKRAARVGFDWSDPQDVLSKLTEEAQELVDEIGGDPARIEDEYGDLLFVLVNLARHLDVDPEAALRSTNAKFDRRFREVERRLAAQGRTPAQASLAEMDALWTTIKVEEKSSKNPAANS
ncbi:MAG: nucleoside triphosphate pyrophosphohydrolase [Pseudomonadota bacterium]